MTSQTGKLLRYHYNIWSNPNEDGISLLDQIFQKLVEVEREKHGRSRKTTIFIVNSKNIDTVKERAMMWKNLRNKATYRSCNTMGLPHAIDMITADITDRSGAINISEYRFGLKKSTPKSEKFRLMAAIPDKILRIQSEAF